MSAMRTEASTGELVQVADATESGSGKPGKSLPVMRVKIASPFKTYFDEPAHSISAANATGPFDILPHHHNFMTLLSSGELIVRPVRGGEQRIRISGGLMHVKADNVAVFLDI